MSYLILVVQTSATNPLDSHVAQDIIFLPEHSREQSDA